MMTDDELTAIRARVDAATPGPWYAQSYYTGDDWWRVSLHKEEIESAKLTHEQRRQRWFVAQDMCQTDATFLAQAPTDVLALLAEVERLRVIAQALADYAPESFAENYVACQFCDGEETFHPDDFHHGVVRDGGACPVTLARAAPASDQPIH